MNEFLPDYYSENIKRLALGIEPIDAGLQLRVPHSIEVTIDDIQPQKLRPPIERHDTGLYVLLYHPKLVSPVNLRFIDNTRRYVPRRLSIPVLTQTVSETRPSAHRIRRPVMFPGAAYDVIANGWTGLRGRVLRGGKAMRWARIEAHMPGNGQLVGRAHGDDRGEFLLLIDARASPIGDIRSALLIEVTVMVPAIPPVAPVSENFKIDPLWGLPLEETAPLGEPDPVSAGERQPESYIVGASQTIEFAWSRILSGVTFEVV